MSVELVYRCGGSHSFFESADGRVFAEPQIRSLVAALLPEPIRTVQVEPPWGIGRPHDTDRVVREYEFEAGEDKPLSVAIMKGTNRSGKWVYEWHIVYNLTKIVPLKPTPEGMRLLRGHERFHCKGFEHGEGTAKTNKSFSPTVNLWA